MECTVCNQIKQPSRELKNPCFAYDTCRRLVCTECSELSSSEIKCLPLQKRILKFYCKKCRNNEYIDSLKLIMKDKETIIQDKNEIITLLQEKLKCLEELRNNSTSNTTYAKATKCEQNLNPNTTTQINVPNIIIKPKTNQDPTTTKADIDANINPTNLKIGIKKVKLRKGGIMIVKCQTKQDAEVLEIAAKNKLHDAYDITTSKLRNPRVKITNFEQNLSKEEIEAMILNQNEFLSDFSVTYVKKVKDKQNTIFGECSAANFSQLMHIKKVCIGWRRYPVYEDLTVPHCFRCQGFYHKVQDCNNKLICPLCSEEHLQKDCPKNNKCCINCVTSNDRYNLNYKTDHYSIDMECPTYKYHIENLKSKIDYPTQW
ncbi:uncharacterized protein [Leptinotarsa decemlineata]|uniref:uncharacterized protein n=1 Tax=Leptinotarsa decemlineata TaxID=7539 RepID=UPI003D30950C